MKLFGLQYPIVVQLISAFICKQFLYFKRLGSVPKIYKMIALKVVFHFFWSLLHPPPILGAFIAMMRIFCLLIWNRLFVNHDKEEYNAEKIHCVDKCIRIGGIMYWRSVRVLCFGYFSCRCQFSIFQKFDKVIRLNSRVNFVLNAVSPELTKRFDKTYKLVKNTFDEIIELVRPYVESHKKTFVPGDRYWFLKLEINV